MISALIGLLIGTLYTSTLQKTCNVLYVSQEEIMELKQERIKGEDLTNRQMFFDNIDEAVRLATSLPKAYENRTTRVVYSMGSVSGENVHSISKEIHQEIIRLLAKKEDNK